MHVRVHISLLPLFILRINGFISEIERIHLGKHARLSYIFSVIACTSDWRHVGSTLSWLEHVSGAVNGDVDPTNIECYKSINFQVPSPSPPLCTIRPSSPPSVFVLITCESSSSLLPLYDHIASAIVRGANNSLHVGGIPYTCISMQNACSWEKCNVTKMIQDSSSLCEIPHAITLCASLYMNARFTY